MSFDRAPRLETQRLILRPHELSDFHLYLEMWADPDVLRHTIREPRSDQDAWLSLQRVMGSWPLFGFGFWAMELKPSGAFIGDVGFMEARRPFTPDKRGVPELGYALHPAHHGQGLMSETLVAIHAWFDLEFPGQETFALIDDANTASIRVADKFGYKLERRADSEDRKSGLFTRTPLSSPPERD